MWVGRHGIARDSAVHQKIRQKPWFLNFEKSDSVHGPLVYTFRSDLVMAKSQQIIWSLMLLKPSEDLPTS